MKNRTSTYAIITSIVLAVIVALLSIGGTGIFNHLQAPRVTPHITTQRVVPTILPNYRRADWERGMAAAVWTKDGYNQDNAAYEQTLSNIYPQTKATWISMQVSFTQATYASTTILGGSPTLASFTEGVQAAKQAGYAIFFEPLITVTSGTVHWCGLIHPKTVQDEVLWLQNWFHALQPYIIAAQKEGVQQIAIGTELEWMQYHTSASYWNQYISQVSSLFTGKIIYDTNWDFSRVGPYPSWFQNPNLGAIGVSAYLPLVKISSSVPENQAISLWNTEIKRPLDALSVTTHKPVVLSEFGYRDSSDAGFAPYIYTSSLPHDPQQQSTLFNAGFSNIMDDQHIIGAFVWCWSNAARFSLVGHPALQVIAKWYSV